MTLAGDALFNLMLNAVVSFWFGLLVVASIRRFARPSRAGIGIALLLLPIGKLLWDLRFGIPEGSFFWASEQGLKQQLGSFQIGFGAHRWGIAPEGHLWAMHEGGRSPQSVADLASRALRFHVSVYAASALSFPVLAISLAKFAKRGSELAAFRRQTRALLAACMTFEWREIGRRKVRVVSSHGYAGVPFAGGLFRPHIVLPAFMQEHLTEQEREAVIQHELGHVRYFDLAVLVPLELTCAFFWFVPGVKWPLAKLRSLLEQRADDCAVAAGLARSTVANALLIIAELATAKVPQPVLAIAREPSTLRLRIQRLLNPEPARPAKPWLGYARGLLLLWLVLGTLQASACGNHP